MQIRIYFDEKPVYLCDEITPELQEIMHHPDAVYIDELSTPAINSLLHEIKKEEFHAGVIFSNDLEKLRKKFFAHFHVIEAAGGIVMNAKKELLFIFRRGKWDLPKGKMDPGETAEETAAREITEETGVDKLKLHKRIGTTYHTYDEFGKHYLKVSHWFYFTTTYAGEGVPQAEEDITEMKWVPTQQIKKPIANSYANIKDILRTFFDTP